MLKIKQWLGAAGVALAVAAIAQPARADVYKRQAHAAAPMMVKPWYREFSPWFLMAGPFLAVIGCSITIYLAYTQFGDQPIQEGVVKRGLVIEQADTPSAASGVR